MSSLKVTELEDQFVGKLERLAADDDRAALARLRRGLGKEPGFATERDGWVIARLPPLNQRDLSIFALIASLFASHPESGGRGNFGASFRVLGRLNGTADGKPNESVEKRFVALLNTNLEDLGNHLRHAVTLLKANNVAVDWRLLLHDISGWNHSDRWVQLRWSREFWGGGDSTEVEPAAKPAGTAAD